MICLPAPGGLCGQEMPNEAKEKLPVSGPSGAPACFYPSPWELLSLNPPVAGQEQGKG